MQPILNLKVKYRESFRPFAPFVLSEHAGEWFEIDRESPYMLLAAGNCLLRKEDQDPALKRSYCGAFVPD